MTTDAHEFQYDHSRPPRPDEPDHVVGVCRCDHDRDHPIHDAIDLDDEPALTASGGAIPAPLTPHYDLIESGRGLIARRMVAAGHATVDDVYTDAAGNVIGLRPEAYERLADLCSPACRTDNGHTFGHLCVIDMRYGLDRLRDEIRDVAADAAADLAEQFETDPFAITLAATEQAVERLQGLIDAWVETRKEGNRLVLEHRAQLAVLNTALRAMRKVAAAETEETDDV